MQTASSPKDTEYEKEDGNEVSFWAHAMQCNAFSIPGITYCHFVEYKNEKTKDKIVLVGLTSFQVLESELFENALSNRRNLKTPVFRFRKTFRKRRFLKMM